MLIFKREIIFISISVTKISKFNPEAKSEVQFHNS